MPGESRPLTLTLIRDANHAFAALPGVRVRLSGPGQPEQSVELGIDPVIVGSTPDCDIVVQDPYVSRRHCSVTLSEKGAIVRDLGSRNGIWVNAVRVYEALLSPGAGVQLGKLALTLDAGGESVRVPLSHGQHFGDAVGKSVVMRALFARLERAAQTDEPVLLLGESGTGKELLARGIHEASLRRERPFVVFDCSAVAPGVVESELFGHEKGAFTGAMTSRAGLVEAAHGGTLFLDEVGELPLELQPKLLRMLENRTVRRVGANQQISVDVRIVAATHRNLVARVAAGEFREDLYYRLAVVETRIPPLRERRDDITLLVECILARRHPPATIADLPPNTLPMLEAHAWPGNVRELRNMLSRIMVFQANDVLGLPPADPASTPPLETMRLDVPFHAAKDAVVVDFERRYVAAQLEAHGGNVSSAARAMGVSRQFLHKLITEHKLKST